MELTLKSLHDDRDAFLAAGYHLPEFDYDTVHKNTVEHPMTTRSLKKATVPTTI